MSSLVVEFQSDTGSSPWGKHLADVGEGALAVERLTAEHRLSVDERLTTHLASRAIDLTSAESRRRHHPLLSVETISDVVDLDVSAHGRLRVRAVLPEMSTSNGVVTRCRSPAGDDDVLIGDRMAVGWDPKGRLHVGALLTSLRTGAEEARQFPTTCEACGASLGTDRPPQCINESLCPALVVPRVLSQLALAQWMRPGRREPRSAQEMAKVATRLLEEGSFQNEGDLYAMTTAEIHRATKGLAKDAVSAFLADWRTSLKRPFAATVSLIPGLQHHACQVVESFPSLDALLTATEDSLLDAIAPLGGKGRWGRTEEDAERSRRLLRSNAV